MEKGITFVGLDVHSRTVAIAKLPPGASDVVIQEIPNEPKVVRRTFKRLLGDEYELKCCYEAGPCRFEMYRLLTSMGIACEVVAPGLIPVKTGDRIKTDRRDARKLARLYRAGELTAIRVPSSDEEAVRDLVRARDDVRKDLTAARHRLSKFLIRHGRVYSDGTKWTERYWRWLRAQTFERDTERVVFEHYVRQVQHQLEQRSALEKEISLLAASEPYKAPVDKLTALRGISILSAMVLIAELQDFRRFKSPRELMAYIGLVPSERSSGGKEKRGGITKTGNTHVRRILVEAAWAYRHRPSMSGRCRKAVRHLPPDLAARARKAQHRLHRRYARLVARGKRNQVAVTAVARELSGFVWGLMTASA